MVTLHALDVYHFCYCVYRLILPAVYLYIPHCLRSYILVVSTLLLRSCTTTLVLRTVADTGRSHRCYLIRLHTAPATAAYRFTVTITFYRYGSYVCVRLLHTAVTAPSHGLPLLVCLDDVAGFVRLRLR